MAAVAIETWKGPSLTRGHLDGDWRATRLWNVIGAKTQTAALNAVYALGVIPGAQHPDNPRLVCETVACGDGLTLQQVTATYSIPTLGQFDPDPLKALTRWRWVPGTEVQGTDRAFDFTPIMNSAGVPFDQLGQQFKGVMDLTATRNEPFYDAQKALAIQNRTNSDVFTVQGGGTVFKGQCLIVNMGVQTDVYDGVPYASVTYNFRFKQGRQIEGSDEYDAFWDVRLDQGDSGWIDGVGVGTAQRARFCNWNGDELVSPVLLDGTGKPIDDSIQVFSVNSSGDTFGPVDPAANPDALPAGIMVTHVNNPTTSKLIAVYLAFRQYSTYPVLSLRL